MTAEEAKGKENKPEGTPEPEKLDRPGRQAKAPPPERQETRFEGYLSEVVDLVPARTGIYGEIKQALCKIMEGKDKGRVIRRNIAGRIKIGDMIRLPDTSREDRKIIAR